MHICTQNYNTLKRIKEVYKKKNIWLPESGRIVEKAWSIQTTLVDAIITLGNEEVIKSYRKYYDGPIYDIPVSFFNIISEEKIKKFLEIKDYTEAKKNFLWFGSQGLIHKGLDLLLDYFVKHPDLHLHIGGPIDREPRFEKAYFNELYKTPNIHTYGFIDIRSELFSELIKKCLFVIYPSCSEGEPGSIMNVMANGLIPIVTKETGIRVKGFGYLIPAVNIKAIESAINVALQEKNDILKEKSFECFKNTRKEHSIEKFRKSLYENLKCVIKN